jgi:hypothetical protein
MFSGKTIVRYVSGLYYHHAITNTWLVKHFSIYIFSYKPSKIKEDIILGSQGKGRTHTGDIGIGRKPKT